MIKNFAKKFWSFDTLIVLSTITFLYRMTLVFIAIKTIDDIVEIFRNFIFLESIIAIGKVLLISWGLLISSRISCELVIVLFKIYEKLTILTDKKTDGLKEIIVENNNISE